MRFEPVPSKVMFALGSNAVFDDTPVMTRLVAGVSKSPTVKAMGEVGVLVSVV